MKKHYRKVFSIILFILAFVAILPGCQKQKDYQVIVPEHYENKVRLFEEQNKDCESGQVVFIGDSITEGYVLDKFYTDTQYKCYNRGISGDTTSGLLHRLQVSLFDLSPSKIVIMIGINDIFSGKKDNEILNNYYKILNKMLEQSSNADIYIMSILPVCEGFQNDNIQAKNERIVGLNNNLQNYANEHNLTYVDLHNKLKNEGGFLRQELSYDGLHINDDGYAIWTESIKGFLI